MIYFCTYFDENYLSRFLALNKSLSNFNFSYTFYVLALDETVLKFFKTNKFKEIKIINYIDLENEYKELIVAKKNRSKIEYYFTLTPFLPKYIFKKFNVSKISYLDTDFYFFKNPYEKIMNNSNFSSVLVKQDSLIKYGKFNVGWIYINFNFNEIRKIIDEWSTQCAEFCTDIPINGFYADQKYLDNWPEKLKFLKIEEPEAYYLSPWNKNSTIENTFGKNLAFHFHAFEISKNFFSTGFSRYNKKATNKIIERIYLPYVTDILLIEKKYNLEHKNIRNNSGKNLKSIIMFLRKFKFIFQKKIYSDRYVYRKLIS